MTKQFTRRLVFAACTWLIALCSVRPASAAAPMCDERGASAIAPPPVLPIRDVKLEASTPLHCALSAAVVLLAAPTARDDAPRALDHAGRDGWLNQSAHAWPIVGSSRVGLAPVLSSPTAPGYRPSVFRPPRV